jgi:hypothetical protein
LFSFHYPSGPRNVGPRCFAALALVRAAAWQPIDLSYRRSGQTGVGFKSKCRQQLSQTFSVEFLDLNILVNFASRQAKNKILLPGWAPAPSSGLGELWEL